MPYQWNAERERKMLLLAISSANLRPSADTWQRVASLLGDGLTASAVSQKYYKLRKESDTQTGTPPTTPKKRKAEDSDEKKSTPTKRAKQPQREAIDGIPFESDVSDSPQELKAEETAASILDSFSSYHTPFTPAAFYPVMGLEEHMHGQFHQQSNQHNSFLG